MLKNITQTQWVAFIIGAASFLGGATGQLTTLFGANGAAYVASACALVAGLAGVFLMATTGQVASIKQVAAFDDVEKVNIKESAHPAIAKVAVDAAQPKIGSATPETRAVLLESAKVA
jgi:hypothetical protein